MSAESERDEKPKARSGADITTALCGKTTFAVWERGRKRRMDEELKPCPFCGGKAELKSVKRDKRKVAGLYHMIATIGCKGCPCMVSQAGLSTQSAEGLARAMWNTRA